MWAPRPPIIVEARGSSGRTRTGRSRSTRSIWWRPPAVVHCAAHAGRGGSLRALGVELDRAGSNLRVRQRLVGRDGIDVGRAAGVAVGCRATVGTVRVSSRRCQGSAGSDANADLTCGALRQGSGGSRVLRAVRGRGGAVSRGTRGRGASGRRRAKRRARRRVGVAATIIAAASARGRLGTADPDTARLRSSRGLACHGAACTDGRLGGFAAASLNERARLGVWPTSPNPQAVPRRSPSGTSATWFHVKHRARAVDEGSTTNGLT